jgi:predicted regulator of Ras-like GTPase activity (Roadblock/LC7/MglB family)
MTSDIHHSKETVLVSLKVGQLIYTSFRENGFTLLTSPDIPSFVQESFVKKVVQIHWDTYHPPSPGYRAAYIYQLPPSTPGALFGWLYHDGHDELGRSDIPYFISYYLPGPLQHNQLSLILTALQKGPEGWIDRSDYLLNGLESLIIENVQHYKPARKGVVFPAQIWEESHATLQSQVSLNWFFPDISLIQHIPQYQPTTPSVVSQPVNPSLNSGASENESIPAMADPQRQHKIEEPLETPLESLDDKTKNLETILHELVSKPIGIQGAVLVSAEGQAITRPIGLDETTAATMAGTMLYLATSTQQELHWQNIETVSVRSPEGYMILSNCSDDTYLLIKSDKVPMGLLEGEISRTILRLKAALNPAKTAERTEINLNPRVAKPTPIISEQTVIQIQPPSEKNDIVKSDPDSEVTYRGRRISS